MAKIERDVNGELERPKVLATVKSKRRPGVAYDVRLSRDGSDVYCTCPSWRFSKSRPRTCKHLEAYFAAKKAVEQKQTVSMQTAMMSFLAARDARRALVG